VDTNCDPDEVDYIIPGNDDAIRAIRLFAGRIADAVFEGQNVHQRRAAEAAQKTEGEATGEAEAKSGAPGAKGRPRARTRTAGSESPADGADAPAPKGKVPAEIG